MPSELRSEYIVQFVAPYRDPRLKEVQFDEHLYFVNMTREQADAVKASMKRLFDAGIIVHKFEVFLAELSRVSFMDLRRRLTDIKHDAMR